MVDKPSAPATATKYARREHERRFLLAQRPAGQPVRTVAISDRYLIGTTLRLRRMDCIEPAGHAPVLKLTQKVPAPDRRPGLITNIYLSESEFDLFAALPAAC